MLTVFSRTFAASLLALLMTLFLGSKALASEEREYSLSDVGTQIQIPASDLTCANDYLKSSHGPVWLEGSLGSVGVTCADLAQSLTDGALVLTVKEIGDISSVFAKSKRSRNLAQLLSGGFSCEHIYDKQQKLRFSFDVKGRSYEIIGVNTVGSWSKFYGAYEYHGVACAYVPSMPAL